MVVTGKGERVGKYSGIPLYHSDGTSHPIPTHRPLHGEWVHGDGSVLTNVIRRIYSYTQLLDI